MNSDSVRGSSGHRARAGRGAELPRPATREIRVAIAGVGSCASSLLQAVVVGAAARVDTPLPGVIWPRMCGYELGNIRFVAAFDVDQEKVGRELSEAAFTDANAAVQHVALPSYGVSVQAGPLLDGLEGGLSRVVQADPRTTTTTILEVAQSLRNAGADVLVCYLPTGAFNAVRAYASAAVEAGVAFINATPEPVAVDPEYQALFRSRGVPLLGDDVRSLLGATALHTALIEFFQSRAVEVVHTYQLNIGGNADFLNMADSRRSASKSKSKRNALRAALGSEKLDPEEILAGPNGFVKYLGDTKICYLRLEGNSLLDSEISVDLRLQVEDSPNSAGVIVNALRVAKIARDHAIAGPVQEVCAFLFKNPPCGATESEGLRLFKEFIARFDADSPAGDARAVTSASA